MNPVKIEGDARPLGAPPGWSEEEHGRCAVLWVRQDMDGGVPFLRSAWDVTAEEAGWMLAGAKLQLGICGNSHPVVNLGLGPIPEDFLPPLTVEQFVMPTGTRSARVVMYLPSGLRIYSTAPIDEAGLGAAVAVAIAEIEKLAKQEGLL